MNKFAAILKPARDPEAVTGESAAETRLPASTAALRPVGRPTGKRTDPDYQQVTAYIRQQTHQRVKIALLQDGDGQEFSELVEELLGLWLESRT